ncbi:MAG: histidine phosphatase family protein [Candidatus Woesearchaeota archaeon]
MEGGIIYLARHGETHDSLENRMGGDSGLTERGIKQAENIAHILKDAPFHAIYCSPLRRATHTAQIIHEKHPGIPLRRRPELTEIDPGDMDGMLYDDFRKNFPELHDERRRDKYNWKFPCGESYASATERAAPIIEDLMQRMRGGGGPSLVVGHQGINRVIMGSLLELSEKTIPYITIPHDMAFMLDPQKKVMRISNGRIEQGYDINIGETVSDV